MRTFDHFKPPQTYCLEGHTPVPCRVQEAVPLLSDLEYRRVGLTSVSGYRVSTVFNPMPISKEALFETGVLLSLEGLPPISIERRYSTWKDAERGHAQVVEEVRKRLRISPPSNRRIYRAQRLRQWERHEWLLDQQWNRHLSWIYQVWLVETLEAVCARPMTFKDLGWDFVVTPTGFKTVPRRFTPSGASRQDWVIDFNGPPLDDVKNR